MNPATHEETDDEAVADLETSLDVAGLERVTLRLHDAVKALGRLHEPDFGLCADCRDEIPLVRLNAEPASIRCIACQREQERRAPAVARL